MAILLAGRVRLVDPIGEGGTGTVWRGWDVRDRVYVAAKLVPRSRASREDRRLRLEHPHILTPDEWLAEEGTEVAVMRLVRGGTADRLLADHGALPSAYVAVLLDQMLAALAALHRSGLVHRDVKPANLLLEPVGTGRPHLYLGDLGTAAPSAQTPSSTVGTVGYVAPEVGAGATPDPRHDLFAAGVTAAELATGRVPRCRRDLPRGPLRRLLSDLTDADPGHRPATADEARARLRSSGVPDGTPWLARPHPPDIPDRMRRLTLLEAWRVQGRRAAQ